MMASKGEFEFRVTNVYRSDGDYIAFSGVPTEFNERSSAKEIFVVNTKPSLVATPPAIGQCWRVQGEFERVRVNHGSYYIDELRITPNKAECILPETKEAIIRFLAETRCFKGIGESKARVVVETFPNDLFRLLKNNDTEKLISKTGLTHKAADALVEGFKNYSNLEYSQWLSDIRVPMDVIQKIIRFHQLETIAQITDNPYRLLHFGLPFHTLRRNKNVVKMGVDEIAHEHFGVTKDDPRRLSGAVNEVMKKIADEGSSCATEARVIKHLKRLIGNNKDLIKQALKYSKETASIKITKGNIYHSLGILVMENVVAKRLLSLKRQSFWSAEHDKVFHHIVSIQPFSLLERQIEAVRGALENGVFAVTGGAGTGKTTVLNAIMRGYAALNFTVRGIALSGRAAMRMNEATGFECCTIAKFLLEKKYAEGVNGIVIIDEASMIDLKNMYRILMHIPTSMRLLFVGDEEQLPPIGAGLVFSDIIESGVIPKIKLEEVKRQVSDSGIPAYSLYIKEGKLPTELSNLNVTFHESSADTIDKTAIELLKAFGVKETQIITPTNSKKNIINIQCQDRINPDGERMIFQDNGQYQHIRVRQNDPVIFTQNNYDAKVWNGTMGYLTQASSKDPEILGIVEDDSGAEVPITFSLVDSLELSYAITLHKAQGSQFKRVVIALTNSRQLDRSWLYTAITRATEHVHIIGTKEMLVDATERVGAAKRRNTFLKSLLIHGGKAQLV